MSLTPGSRLGPYEVVARIGAGGMGEVYRATDTRLKRQVAIKVLPSSLATDQERLARFQREAEVLASLNHPHIAAIYGLEERDGTTALVMELVDGDDLSQRVAQGALPLDQALPIAAQIADALESAHAKGVIHRDLKPANIRLRADGTVKVLDFGLAKALDPGAGSREPGAEAALADSPTITSPALTDRGVILGTAAYMSPEQAQGRAVDQRSDIFSFGAVLYELLGGKRPFRGDSVLDVLSAVLRDDPAPLPVPAPVGALLQRCLAKRAADRYASVQELRAALRALAKDAPATATAQPSIAVLPFANLGGDKDNDYFSDGLAEEILNGLTGLPGIRVIARASAFAYRGREHEVGVIAQKLGVTNVLHGSVRRSGNRIRVTANLIDVRDESQIWSERYDREMRDVFDIQDEIAQAIVDKLQVRLGARAGQPLMKRYTENPEAHSLYLRGNHLLYRMTLEDMEKGKAYLEQAVALEPGHAPAWVQLADYYIAGCFIGRAPAKSLWPMAKDAAERAVAADPEYAEAQAAVGFVMALGEHRWADGMRHLETALRLNPASARAHFWLAQVQMPLGRLEESLENAQRASALDPLFLLYRYGCGERLLDLRRWEEAANEARQVLDIDPNYSLCQIQLAHAYIGMRRYDEAIGLLETALESANRRHYIIGVLGLAYVGAGRRGDAERFLARLEDERRRGHMPASALALVAIALGDHAAALHWIGEAIDERDANLISLVAAPYFEPLRADPAYQALRRRMNLS